MILFKGRIGTVDNVGRTSAQITVNSDLVLLDLQMPRNVYSPACQHVLYDSGCTLIKSAFGTAGTVGTGSIRISRSCGYGDLLLIDFEARRRI